FQDGLRSVHWRRSQPRNELEPKDERGTVERKANSTAFLSQECGVVFDGLQRAKLGTQRDQFAVSRMPGPPAGDGGREIITSHPPRARTSRVSGPGYTISNEKTFAIRIRNRKTTGSSGLRPRSASPRQVTV